MATTKRRPTATPVIPRAELARLIQRRIKATGLTRDLAATLVGDAASQVSRLMTNHLDGFSAERLIRMLTRLGANVDIVIRQQEAVGPRGKVRIITAPVAKRATRRPR
jgi:predicted XRE-type DNA-binding protein